MIQLLTKVNIIDNSGGVVGRCIKILRPHGRDYAKIGDMIIVSILEIAKIEGNKKGSASSVNTGSIRDSNKIKKGTMFKALVVRTKSNTVKKTATFDENAVVLLKSASGGASSASAPKGKQTKLYELPPIGTRIKGPISVLLASNKATSDNSFPLGNTATKITSLCPKGHLY
jgi:ribosomal protein L14